VNFKVTVSGHDKNPKSFGFQKGTVKIEPNTLTPGFPSISIVMYPRADGWLDVRIEGFKRDGTFFSFVLESDPVADPNHWLNVDDSRFLELVSKGIVKKAQRDTLRKRRERTRCQPK